MALGTILAVGSGLIKAGGAKRRGKDIEKAQAKQNKLERNLRDEQAVRERRKQVRLARIGGANAEAMALAGGAQDGSGAASAQAAVQNDLATNLGNLNLSISSAESLSGAKSGVMNAGQPTFFESLNDVLSPAINNNIGALNDLGTSAVSAAAAIGK